MSAVVLLTSAVLVPTRGKLPKEQESDVSPRSVAEIGVLNNIFHSHLRSDNFVIYFQYGIFRIAFMWFVIAGRDMPINRKPVCFIAMAFGREDTDLFYEKQILPVLKKNNITPIIINRQISNDDLNIQIFK